jgi:hypothetical protein
MGGRETPASSSSTVKEVADKGKEGDKESQRRDESERRIRSRLRAN